MDSFNGRYAGTVAGELKLMRRSSWRKLDKIWNKGGYCEEGVRFDLERKRIEMGFLYKTNCKKERRECDISNQVVK